MAMQSGGLSLDYISILVNIAQAVGLAFTVTKI